MREKDSQGRRTGGRGGKNRKKKTLWHSKPRSAASDAAPSAPRDTAHIRPASFSAASPRESESVAEDVAAGAVSARAPFICGEMSGASDDGLRLGVQTSTPSQRGRFASAADLERYAAALQNMNLAQYDERRRERESRVQQIEAQMLRHQQDQHAEAQRCRAAAIEQLHRRQNAGKQAKKELDERLRQELSRVAGEDLAAVLIEQGITSAAALAELHPDTPGVLEVMGLATAAAVTASVERAQRAVAGSVGGGEAAASRKRPVTAPDEGDGGSAKVAKKARTGDKQKEEDVAEFTCPICLDLCEDVVESPCGHLFCRGCLNEVRGTSPGAHDLLSCPVCRVKSRWAGWFPSAYVQRKINAIPVPCPHDGCDSIVPKGELKDHVSSCQHAPTPAPAALTTTPTVLTITCPEGAVAGTTLRVRADVGGWRIEMDVVVPGGHLGRQLNIQLPSPQAAAAAGAGRTAATGRAPEVRMHAQFAQPAETNPDRRPDNVGSWNSQWSERYTRWYWWHSDTRVTSWTRPDPAAFAAEQALAAVAEATRASAAHPRVGTTVTVKCPAGVIAGEHLRVRVGVGDGREFGIVVPEGVSEGDSFNVQLELAAA